MYWRGVLYVLGINLYVYYTSITPLSVYWGSGDVGFVTWRTSSYGIKLIVGLRCGEKGWESLGGLYRKGGRFVIRIRDGDRGVKNNFFGRISVNFPIIWISFI